MFSSLRSRLWISYATLIVTALGVVAMIIFIYLLQNPFLYRQTLESLRAVQTVLLERADEPQAQPLSLLAVRASHTFKVRIIQYSQDKLIMWDTSSDSGAPLPFPKKRIFSGKIPIARDESRGVWLYSLEQLPDKTYLLVATPRPRVSILKVFTEDFLPLILQGGLIALVLSLFMALLFANWIAAPLQNVVLAARALPSTEAKPVGGGGPREVRELTQAFNSMVARVQGSQRSQREFVANVSHELKTPLTSIQGFSQAILDGTAGSPDETKQAAQVIYDESARMHRLVLDLLDLAQLDAGTADVTMAPVNMTALLNAVAGKFAPQSQDAGVEIKVALPEGSPPVLADGDKLSQVFTNLVDNALKFTPRGGLINIRASVLNGEMIVSVSDTGAGISLEAQAHIFDRFYQADPVRKGGAKHGAGLGLAIAREILQAHGGRITVRSEPGEGTTFQVVLPLTQAPKTSLARNS